VAAETPAETKDEAATPDAAKDKPAPEPEQPKADEPK
jgi:hypothetical protein